MIGYILSPSYFQKLFTKLKIQKNGLTNIFSFLLSTTLLPNSNLKKKKKELSLIPNHFHFHFKHLSLLSNSTTRIIHFSIIPLISTHFKPNTIDDNKILSPSPPLHLETNKQTKIQRSTKTNPSLPSPLSRSKKQSSGEKSAEEKAMDIQRFAFESAFDSPLRRFPLFLFPSLLLLPQNGVSIVEKKLIAWRN